MRLYSAFISIFRHQGEMEVILPALSPEAAATKVRNLAFQGKLFVSFRCTRINPHTDKEEEIQTKERVRGLLNSCEIMLLHHSANHRRRWSESKTNKDGSKGGWVYPCPRYHGRDLYLTHRRMTDPALDRQKAYKQGFLSAKASYAPRKNAETALKTALKNYAGNFPEQVAAGFRRGWELQMKKKPASKPANKKPASKKPASKKTAKKAAKKADTAPLFA